MAVQSKFWKFKWSYVDFWGQILFHFGHHFYKNQGVQVWPPFLQNANIIYSLEPRSLHSKKFDVKMYENGYLDNQKHFLLGLRILRNGGTSPRTSGTVVNQILLVPQYSYKNHNFGGCSTISVLNQSRYQLRKQNCKSKYCFC